MIRSVYMNAEVGVFRKDNTWNLRNRKVPFPGRKPFLSKELSLRFVMATGEQA